MVFTMTKLSLFTLEDQPGQNERCVRLRHNKWRARPRQRVAKGEIDIPDGLLTIE